MGISMFWICVPNPSQHYQQIYLCIYCNGILFNVKTTQHLICLIHTDINNDKLYEFIFNEHN